jgi:hypothetical protein
MIKEKEEEKKKRIKKKNSIFSFEQEGRNTLFGVTKLFRF